MITKQICYCEYCGTSFVGEDSADKCMLHESNHAKRIVIDGIEANCVDTSITSGTIIPQVLIIPYGEKGTNVLNCNKTYAVYKLVHQYNSQKQGRAKEAAQQAAEEITKNGFFFKPEFEMSADKGDSDVKNA